MTVTMLLLKVIAEIVNNEDATFRKAKDEKTYYVMFNDFNGFNADWSEDWRDFTDEELIDNFKAILRIAADGNVDYIWSGHIVYTVDDINWDIQWASNDI